MAISCTLKYLARGVSSTRETRKDLERELFDNIANTSAVTVLPVVEGLAIDVELTDIHPFSEHSIEPYLAEQILPESIAIACKPSEPAQLHLIKLSFN